MLTRIAAAALALSLTSIAASADDRAPTPEERTKIEAALQAEGFTSWGEIELDDGKEWEIDDAIAADGTRYDLKLRVDTLEIFDRDRED